MAGRHWVPSGRPHVHLDGGWFVAGRAKVRDSYRCLSTHWVFFTMTSISKGQVRCVDDLNQILNFTDFSMHPVKEVDYIWETVVV